MQSLEPELLNAARFKNQVMKKRERSYQERVHPKKKKKAKRKTAQASKRANR